MSAKSEAPPLVQTELELALEDCGSQKQGWRWKRMLLKCSTVWDTRTGSWNFTSWASHFTVVSSFVKWRQKCPFSGLRELSDIVEIKIQHPTNVGIHGHKDYVTSPSLGNSNMASFFILDIWLSRSQRKMWLYVVKYSLRWLQLSFKVTGTGSQEDKIYGKDLNTSLPPLFFPPTLTAGWS